MTQPICQLKISSLRVAVLAAIVCVLFGAGSRVEATTIIRMDVAELSDQAELVFTGTAVRTRVERSQDGEPHTFVTFAVHDVLKGWTLERQIALRFAGGETEDGAVMTLQGMPEFEQGKTYLLFVRGNGSVFCPVLGWGQGQFRFEREPGSGKQILVDTAGVQLRGIAQGRFERQQRAERSDGAGMTVLSEEGVHIELPERTRKASATADEATDAAQVVEQLRSYIAGRASAATFRPGRRVDSARAQDLPVNRAEPAVRPQ